MIYKVALTMIDGVGGVTARKLVAHFGSPKAIFDASPQTLRAVLNNSTYKNFRSDTILHQAEKELKYMQHNDINVLFYTDADFPYRLNRCEDAPVALFAKGNANLNNSKTISIVGTRKASNYGISLCRELVAQLAKKGHKPLIISGLAYGIDVCAHLAALEAGLETVAVMGTGLNKIYPAAHDNIATQIARQGALLTEYVSEQTIVPGNFLSRNRIVAGLADVTVVVESGIKGGALVTADIANSYNREVMAVPGRTGDQLSKGCNRLIKTNIAAMLESVEDLENQMNWSKNQQEVQQKIDFIELSLQEQNIAAFLRDRGSADVNAIAVHTGISIPDLSLFLLNMELSKLITVLPGNSYAIKSY
ncbi:MAG: DNA-processing protein DprA [Prevotellaceae bacterium]|nr:DNA-processing protein DprA [Prevotellaceae bacterium]